MYVCVCVCVCLSLSLSLSLSLARSLCPLGSTLRLNVSVTPRSTLAEDEEEKKVSPFKFRVSPYTE